MFWLAESVYRAGVETHMLDGVAVEALRTLGERGQLDPDELLPFARICRVEAVVKPYLQALA